MNRQQRRWQQKLQKQATRGSSASSTQASFAEAVKCHQAGQLQQAAEICQQILETQASNADVLNLLGVIAHQTGKPTLAIDLFNRAIDAKPHFVEAHYHLGLALQVLGRLDEAIVSNRRALEIKPRFAEAHNSLGNILQGQGKLEEAIACYYQALEIKPRFAEAHNNLGNILQGQGNLTEAAAYYRRALDINPRYAEAYNNLGITLNELGKPEEAATSCQHALAINPRYAEAYNNLGIVLKGQGKLEAAIESYHGALKTKPHYAEAYYNMGNALREQGKIEEAITTYHRALEIKPDNAEAHWNYALVLLLMGHFEEGWKEYEWRWKKRGFTSPKRDFPQPLWDGSPLPGKTILLHAEQGFGDTIQFIRYAALVAERSSARIVVECHPALKTLLKSAEGVHFLVPRGEALPDFDAHAPLLSLPRLLKTDIESIPAKTPYLFATPSLPIGPDEHPKTKVGIVWAGRPTHVNDRNRSVSLEDFSKIFSIGNCEFYSLQVGERRSDLSASDYSGSVVDLGEAFTDFSVTASAIQQLDLVISVDTSVTHLAGALGKPVWTLLPFIPDWRWMLEREDSPWYPTMRLFRQTRAGDWAGVFNRVESALQQYLANAKK